ncbi:universal stress protein [Nocardioides sp. LMS-CY]|uniref:universal stress protein n=1 Tax=Nocardioides sp. (strain LMS-CY) TaxID=2840457 RepID=UPI001C0074A3|nr:universal stress protein [Nocardioides sp. LMS-CY]QWF21006.1 universal stress protein [Nocardioides sp. LMS-CY]
MTGRIVVGIDGSQHSGNALEWAVARARLGGEQLELISAYSVAPALDFYSYHALADSQPIDWYAEHSQQVLEAAVTRVRELAPELACTLTPARGHAANLLATASEGADVVVVGRRGLGRAASALLGSVSNRLTVEAKCPVVVVGDGELPTRGPIVVGVDGSEFGTSALRYALGEAALRRTTVRAVAAYDFLSQVYRIDAELTERIRKEAEAQAAETITRAAEEARWADPASVGVAEVVVEGPPAEAILAHAGDAQLVVVGTHGKGIVRRVLMGSVSRQVLHDADRPVAVVDHRGD